MPAQEHCYPTQPISSSGVTMNRKISIACSRVVLSSVLTALLVWPPGLLAWTEPAVAFSGQATVVNATVLGVKTTYLTPDRFLPPEVPCKLRYCQSVSDRSRPMLPARQPSAKQTGPVPKPPLRMSA